MNKTTPEYIRIREETRTLLYMCNAKLNDARNETNPTLDEFADAILKIKGIAILADDQTQKLIICTMF